MKVSIIIPTMNRCSLLSQTLDSVQSQSYADWEVIVVDDGSTDATEVMVQALAVKDKRVRFVRRDRNPKGAPTCRNIGLDLAKGEFIVFLDSDDLLAKECLAERIAIIDSNKKLMFIVGQAERFNEIPGDANIVFGDGEECHDLMRVLCMHYPWQTAAVLWRRDVFRSLGTWDEDLKIGQDVDLSFRAIINRIPYQRLHKIDFYYRENHEGVGGGYSKYDNQDSHLRRIEKARELLSQNKMYIRGVQNIITGNYLWVATNLYSTGHCTEGKEVWKRAKEAACVPFLFYLLVLLMLSTKDRPRIKHLLAPVFYSVLPRGYLVRPSCEKMTKQFIDRKGDYLPVHAPEASGDCFSDGRFFISLWLLHYIKAIMRRILPES